MQLRQMQKVEFVLHERRKHAVIAKSLFYRDCKICLRETPDRSGSTLFKTNLHFQSHQTRVALLLNTIFASDSDAHLV